MMPVTNQSANFPPEIRAAYTKLKCETLAALETHPHNLAKLHDILHRLCGAAGMFDEATLGHEAGLLEIQLSTLTPSARRQNCLTFAAFIHASL